MEGWVKLHRKLLGWGWSSSAKHMSIFTHLLMRANHKRSSWRKVTVYPGQILTGRKQLSAWTGVPERGVRTVLSDLQTTGEVTIKSFSKFSIITIVNWSSYQSGDQQKVKKRPANAPSNDQQATTSKNVKNVKKKEIKGKEVVVEKVSVKKIPESLRFLDQVHQEWLVGITENMARKWTTNYKQQTILEAVDSCMVWNSTAKNKHSCPPLGANNWIKKLPPDNLPTRLEEFAVAFDAAFEKQDKERAELARREAECQPEM